MRSHQWTSIRAGKGIVLALVLALSGATIAFASADRSPLVAAQTQDRLESTIFSYDGRDFVRTRTTLLTEEGKPAVNTKLDHDSPAYEALMRKHSYTGNVTLFGRTYEASYAPLMSDDGRLTGALFVAGTK